MSDNRLCFEDEHLQVIQRDGSSAFILATFSNFGFAANGKAFWGESLCAKEDFRAIGFVAKANNWFPESSMRRAQAALPVADRPVVTYGHSQGGYAALKYAALLGAAGVLAFAPQFSINPSVVPRDRRFHQNFVPELHANMEIETADIAGNPIVIFDPYDDDDSYNIQHLTKSCEVPRLAKFYIHHLGHGVTDVVRQRRVILSLIEAAIDGGELSTAFSLARAAKKKSHQYGICVATRLLKLSKPRLALSVLDRVAQLAGQPASGPDLVRRARISSLLHEALGATAEAVLHAQAAVTARPNDAASLARLGTCLLADGRPADAIEIFEQAIKILPPASNLRQSLVAQVNDLMASPDSSD
jgi:tetratricopeptide (TPR) repeat protein